MSQRGTEFIERWIQENFHAKDPHDRGDRRAAQWAQECVRAAIRAGIPQEEIEEDFGDLEEFMEMAITEQNQLRIHASVAQQNRAEFTPERSTEAGSEAARSDRDGDRNAYGNLVSRQHSKT